MSGPFSGIDPRSATPLYAQIAERVRRSIAAGELAPGDELPSVRSLATKLRVNPSAITHAYRELAREGLAEIAEAGSAGGPRIVRTLSPETLAARAAEPGARARPAGARRSREVEQLAQLPSGHVIDERFVVRRLLGAGAMGAVYLAHDRELDEEVALKVLPPLNTTDETAVRRFLNEIRVARRISHRNVVRTHDVGRWSGGLFLTMEYVEGRTLRELLDEKRTLASKEVITLGAQLADALAVAHERDVIHRDIKPQNVLIDRSNQAKILDFGISVIQGSSGQLTEAGRIVGTPAYMAPEQLLGEAVTPASDLYAVGVVLYEAATGALPYAAATPMTLVAQIVQRGPTPMREAHPDCDPLLESIVMRLLSHDLAIRPKSAIDLRDELRGSPGPRRPSRPSVS